MRNNRQKKRVQKTKWSTMWTRHWKKFYNTLGKDMPRYWRLTYEATEDYLVLVFQYYTFLNNHPDLKIYIRDCDFLIKHSNEALFHILIVLIEADYPILRHIIVYAWISNGKKLRYIV